MLQSSPETVSLDALSQARAHNEQLQGIVDSLSARIEELTRQLDWFKQQLFGTRSEKRHVDGESTQLNLGEVLAQAPLREERASTEVQSHRRQRGVRPGDESAQLSHCLT